MNVKVFGLVIFILLLIPVFSIEPVSASQDSVRVLIEVNSDFNPNLIASVNGRIVAKCKALPIIIADIPPNAIDHMKRAKGVINIDLDAKVHILGKPSSPPGKGKNKAQPSQTIPWGVDRVHAPDAWSITTGYTGGVIEVAVLDTGIDYDHPDLKDNIAWGVSTLHGRVSYKPNDYKDVNGHGTHVAGIIAALNNNIGVVGVAPGVEIYAIKVLGNDGSGWISDIVLGIDQALLGPDGVLDSNGNGKIVGDPADDAAEVISMSFGGSSDVQTLHDVIIKAYNYGVVLVAASGNDGSSSPLYPAAYPEVIAVGAIDKNNNVPDWSNRGIEVSAPGVDILSTYPDDTYETLSGTSMACPHVSGVVALIQATYYNKYGTVLPVGTSDDTSNNTVRGIIHTTAEDLGIAGWDTLYGYGVVDAYSAVQAAS